VAENRSQPLIERERIRALFEERKFEFVEHPELATIVVRSKVRILRHVEGIRAAGAANSCDRRCTRGSRMIKARKARSRIRRDATCPRPPRPGARLPSRDICVQHFSNDIKGDANQRMRTERWISREGTELAKIASTRRSPNAPEHIGDLSTQRMGARLARPR
jgi:hypothetical protein